MADLLIVGGGNAALSAAISAARLGLRVRILEAAPKPYRGGDSRHTRNFRCMHQAPLAWLLDRYDEREYFRDLMDVTGGQSDETLARLVIRSSPDALVWMERNGVRFQAPLSGTLSLARTNAFFLGGGKTLLNALYNTAADLGVVVDYEATVHRIGLRDLYFTHVEVDIGGARRVISASAVVLACGGFQADLDWLARAWGPSAHNFLVRGTPYNRGIVLHDLIAQGVQTVGDPRQFHAVAIDGRAPKYDGGIVTRLDCIPFSLVVNKLGLRFYDEGEDLWPKRYAIWGRLVAEQPDQVAYAFMDARALGLFMPSLFPPVRGQTIAELARQLDLCAVQLSKTVHTFNAACVPGEFTPTELDGLATRGLVLNKTNWARPLLEPPFYAYALRPGVTFTYLGLKVDETARVVHRSGRFHNIWAAGEIMAGNLLGKGYLAGLGMTIGTVFGCLAGRQAAKYVQGLR